MHIMAARMQYAFLYGGVRQSLTVRDKKGLMQKTWDHPVISVTGTASILVRNSTTGRGGANELELVTFPGFFTPVTTLLLPDMCKTAEDSLEWAVWCIQNFSHFAQEVLSSRRRTVLVTREAWVLVQIL